MKECFWGITKCYVKATNHTPKRFEEGKGNNTTACVRITELPVRNRTDWSGNQIQPREWLWLRMCMYRYECASNLTNPHTWTNINTHMHSSYRTEIWYRWWMKSRRPASKASMRLPILPTNGVSNLGIENIRVKTRWMKQYRIIKRWMRQSSQIVMSQAHFTVIRTSTKQGFRGFWSPMWVWPWRSSESE